MRARGSVLASPLLWVGLLFAALLLRMAALRPFFRWAFPGVEPVVYDRASFLELFLSHLRLVAAASLAATLVGVGAGDLRDPPGGARFPHDRRYARHDRADLSAGRGAGDRGAADRLRRAADDRRAVSLRPAADRRERDRRARRRAAGGARRGRRHGAVALAAAARCRAAARRAGRSSPGSGSR